MGQGRHMPRTVAHEHHNNREPSAWREVLTSCAGRRNRLSEIEGRFRGCARAGPGGSPWHVTLPLPVAGLMSLDSYEDVHARLVALRAAAKSLGVTLEEPFLQLAFIALPVIPHLKITDYGMVDVDRFEVI